MDEQHRPEVTGFFHEDTNSVAYIAADPATARCAVIDPVLDFDRNARATYTDFAYSRHPLVRFTTDHHLAQVGVTLP